MGGVLYRLLKQVLVGLTTLWVVVSLTFLLLRVLPGGPFDSDRKLPPEIQANLEAQYHLKDPLWKQYTVYMGNLLRGDLGPSYKYRSRRVNDIVGEAFTISLQLGIYALLVGVSFGVLLGTIAGNTRQNGLDALLSLLGVSTLSTPAFIFGGLLVLLFSLQLHWLPSATLSTPAHWILPVATLSLAPFAWTFLLIRSSVQEVKTLSFVHIKACFGLSPKTIQWRHILRNALLPLVAIAGPLFAGIITGSFAVEYLFAIPGVGKHFVTAVTNRDYTLVMGVTILYGAILIAFNTLSDMVSTLLDPRLREEARS